MAATFHVYFGPKAFESPIEVRRIRARDCFGALKEGFADFLAMPTYVAFVGIFYALAGIALAALSSFDSALQLVFPLAAGFALLGPFFALGLYEISRRREVGLKPSWRGAFAVLGSPALPSVIMLGLFLLTLFALWIGAAQYLYTSLYGPKAPASAAAFLHEVLTTSRGHTLILFGCAVGFCFAALSLMISIVSFPLMLDRDVGLAPAIVASTRLTRENPGPVALWGAIVVALLVVGSLPLFIGLAVVMPVLGHATWRFYRRAIVRAPADEVPIEDLTGEGLVETPGLKEFWSFLDLLYFFRNGRI
jgi:uncharacterized membrane protein